MNGFRIMENYPENGEFVEPAEYWRKTIPDGAFDTVVISTEELEKIGGGLLCEPQQRALYIENAPLPHFTLVAEDAGVKFHFTPSAFNGMTIINPDGGGSVGIRFNAHVCSSKTGMKYLGMQISTGTWTGEIPQAACDVVYTHESFNDEPDGGVGVLRSMFSIALQSYILVQAIMLNRPTMFHEKKTEVVVTPGNNKRGKKHRNRVVKTCRVIMLDRAEAEAVKAAGGLHRVITCPAWGVIGHYRHYKNGKAVWVKPYKKGKFRDVDGVYSPKRYDVRGNCICEQNKKEETTI